MAAERFIGLSWTRAGFMKYSSLDKKMENQYWTIDINSPSSICRVPRRIDTAVRFFKYLIGTLVQISAKSRANNKPRTFRVIFIRNRQFVHATDMTNHHSCIYSGVDYVLPITLEFKRTQLQIQPINTKGLQLDIKGFMVELNNTYTRYQGLRL